MANYHASYAKFRYDYDIKSPVYISFIKLNQTEGKPVIRHTNRAFILKIKSLKTEHSPPNFLHEIVDSPDETAANARVKSGSSFC